MLSPAPRGLGGHQPESSRASTMSPAPLWAGSPVHSPRVEVQINCPEWLQEAAQFFAEPIEFFRVVVEIRRDTEVAVAGGNQDLALLEGAGQVDSVRAR